MVGYTGDAKMLENMSLVVKGTWTLTNNDISIPSLKLGHISEIDDKKGKIKDLKEENKDLKDEN